MSAVSGERIVAANPVEVVFLLYKPGLLLRRCKTGWSWPVLTTQYPPSELRQGGKGKSLS